MSPGRSRPNGRPSAGWTRRAACLLPCRVPSGLHFQSWAASGTSTPNSGVRNSSHVAVMLRLLHTCGICRRGPWLSAGGIGTQVGLVTG